MQNPPMAHQGKQSGAPNGVSRFPQGSTHAAAPAPHGAGRRRRATTHRATTRRTSTRSTTRALRGIVAKQRRASLRAAKAIYKRGGRPVLSAAEGATRTPSCAVWGKRNCLPGYHGLWHDWGFCFCRLST